MADKGFNLFYVVLPDVYVCPLKKKNALSLPEGKARSTHFSA